MNKKEFLQRLSEVSEWHRPHLGPNGCYSVAKGKTIKLPEHPGTVTEQELEEMSEHEVKCYYDRLLAWREAQPNESVPPEITQVKVQAVDCEDCGRYCEYGRRTQRKLHDSGSRHWREFCVECEQFKDPATGKFTVPKLGSHQYFNDYYKPKLGLYRSKYQPEPKAVKVIEPKVPKPPKLTKSQLVEKIISEGSWHTTETDHSIIRRFEQKK